MARELVWIVIVMLVAYDCAALTFGLVTVSEAVRQIDRQTGGMVRWGLLGLWGHWFLGVWPER